MLRRMLILMALGILLPLSLPAAAGGSWMESPHERIEAGDETIFVGYVQMPRDGWEDLEWVATLSGPMPEVVNQHSVLPEVMVVGPVTLDPTGIGGYLGLRVSVAVTLPDDMEAGVYSLDVRGPGGEFLSDLIGAMFAVGLEPESEKWLEWALDEPLIAELPDHAMVAGPGFAISAADLRAGRYPMGAEMFLRDPSILDQSDVEFVPSDIVFLDPPVIESEVPATEVPEVEVEAPVVIDPITEFPSLALQPLQQEDGPSAPRAMWWLLSVSALVGILLIVARRRPVEGLPEETERELSSVG